MWFVYVRDIKTYWSVAYVLFLISPQNSLLRRICKRNHTFKLTDRSRALSILDSTCGYRRKENV